MSSDVSFSALTDVGRKREENEDNFLVDESLGVYVVCDGMGGHAAGEVASALAVRTFHDEVKKERDLLEDYAAGKTGAARVSKRDITNMLEFAVNRASARVHAEAAKDAGKRGMGTTLVAVVICGQTAFIIYVGDSRLYLERDGILEQVTEDHNVFNELIKRKKMSREQVEKLAHKNAITRAIGVYEHAEPDTIVLDLIAGDRMLLCSDGLYQYFEDDLDDLSARMTQTDLDVTMKKFIEDANEAGGSDNITGILLSVGEATERDVSRARRLQLKRELLAKMRLFRPLSDRELLRVLQVTEVLAFEDGTNVMTQGETGEELYIVLEGRVDILRGEAVIATLEQGAHVGEMALVRNQPRSASVRSRGKSELMVIRRRDFFELLRNEHALAVKLLWQFLGVVADRLADTSRELGQAREELEAEDLTGELFEDHDSDSYNLGEHYADDEDEDEDDEEMDRPTLVAPPPDLLGVINEPTGVYGAVSRKPPVPSRKPSNTSIASSASNSSASSTSLPPASQAPPQSPRPALTPSAPPSQKSPLVPSSPPTISAVPLKVPAPLTPSSPPSQKPPLKPSAPPSQKPADFQKPTDSQKPTDNKQTADNQPTDKKPSEDN